MHITLIMAVTADGKIARSSDHFPDWTSKEDKLFFQEASKDAGVVIFGEKTFDTLPFPLKGRLNTVFCLEPEKRVPAEGVLFVSGDLEPVLSELEKMGYNKAVLGGGAFLNSLFLEKGLVDEICLSIEPLIFGEGLSLFSKPLDAKLGLKEVTKLNENTVVLKYSVLKNS